MSKKIKNLIERELETKFKDIEGCAVVSSRGLDGNKNNKLRLALPRQGHANARREELAGPPRRGHVEDQGL